MTGLLYRYTVHGGVHVQQIENGNPHTQVVLRHISCHHFYFCTVSCQGKEREKTKHSDVLSGVKYKCNLNCSVNFPPRVVVVVVYACCQSGNQCCVLYNNVTIVLCIPSCKWELSE